MKLFNRTGCEDDAPKELVLISANGTKGSLGIPRGSTLEDVRQLIDGEFDDDMIPPDFAFHVMNDVRISMKQEKKKLAWGYLDKGLSIKSKQRVHSVEAMYGQEEEKGDTPSQSVNYQRQRYCS